MLHDLVHGVDKRQTCDAHTWCTFFHGAHSGIMLISLGGLGCGVRCTFGLHGWLRPGLEPQASLPGRGQVMAGPTEEGDGKGSGRT
jgi:hypothetical protein